MPASAPSWSRTARPSAAWSPTATSSCDAWRAVRAQTGRCSPTSAAVIGWRRYPPDEQLDRAIEVMRERAVRRVPVIEDRRAVGILSLGDLALNREPRSVLADISQATANR
ncbi:MAG: CBS domain-containing protein [Vicinamibacterales bacterium]